VERYRSLASAFHISVRVTSAARSKWLQVTLLADLQNAAFRSAFTLKSISVLIMATCWNRVAGKRQARSLSYINANEIPTAEMIVAITSVTSSSSRVTFHRMVPTSSLIAIALLTEDHGRWFPVGLKKTALPSI
jgi:hypothetical protein